MRFVVTGLTLFSRVCIVRAQLDSDQAVLEAADGVQVTVKLSRVSPRTLSVDTARKSKSDPSVCCNSATGIGAIGYVC